MDLEQLNKRVDWLDDERRKDKLTISTLEERLASIEASISPLSQQIKEINTDLARLSAQLSRFDQIETNVLQLRVETNRMIEAMEKTRAEREREAEKTRRAEQETVNPGRRQCSCQSTIRLQQRERDPVFRQVLQSRVERLWAVLLQWAVEQQAR